MKGYKRLKIPISSGCQAGPGSRHQVDVREMVEKWNAACSLLIRVSTINTCQQRVWYSTLKSDKSHESKYSYGYYQISMLNFGRNLGIHLDMRHGI